MPKCDPSNQENDSKSTISNSSEENKSEKVNDNEEISSKTEEQSSSTLFQSIHECGTPLQNCTEILNEILTTSLHLSDNDCVKSDVNSAYLSVKTSAEDLTSNLTSFKTFASEIKEASTVTEFLSGKEFLSPKESKTATKIVAPILTVKESKIVLNREEEAKRVNFKDEDEDIIQQESKTKSLVQSEQKSGDSNASDPEEIVNDALKNKLIVKEVNDSLDIIDTFSNGKRSGTTFPCNFAEWSSMEEVVTQVHFSKESFDEASQVNLPFPDVNLMNLSESRSLPRITSGDHASTQVSCPENMSGEFRTYRISEYDLPPNYSSIIQNENSNYREINENIPLSMILSRYGEPRPSVPFIYRVPPPSYDESEFINTDVSLPSLAISSPFWGPKPQAALCHICSAFCVTRTRYRINFGTHMFALFLCICLCWPCCLLPYYTPACKYTEHFCPSCHTLLGIYDPCRNSSGGY